MNSWGRRAAMFSLAMSLLSSCAAQRILTRKDYIKMSNEEIRNIFLQESPIGSTEEKVRQVMREKFGRKMEWTIVNDNPEALKNTKKNSDPFINKIELGDYSLNTTLASYGWAKHFFMMGEVIEATWLFTKTGVLKDIRVVRYTDGA